MDRLTYEDATAPNSCRRCDSDIPPPVGRILGDERGVVPVCAACHVSANGIEHTSAAGAIRAYRSRRDDPMGANDDAD